MKIQRFEGNDAREALVKAQQALGKDVMILQTRTVPGTGVLRRPRVEVLAAAEAAAPATPRTPAQAPEAAPIAPIADTSGWQSELTALRREVDQLRCQVVQGTEKEGVRNDPSREELAWRLRTALPTGSIQIKPGVCTKVALVGPTGVGKTTTLAKLAAAATRGERKRVALVTIDTYRVGAIEQLETYARLLEVPVARVHAAEDIRDACRRYASYDIVFVDTTGRAPRNAPQIEEQAALLEAAGMDEVHLCLDSGASQATLQKVLEGFAATRPTHLILTKVDETSSLDVALRVVLDANLPLSYVTTGQRVPEDLALADGPQLADWTASGGYAWA